MADFLLFIFSYFIGSIPFGLIFVKLAGKGDVRDIGSGNIGATNVLRTGSKKLAIFTLLADALKGAIPILISKYLEIDLITQCTIGGLAILGHIFPIWLKFKGGKGIATAAGAYLALCPIIGILTLTTWGITAKIGRISSLSALIAFFMAPIYSCFLVNRTDLMVFTIVVYFIITYTHRDNIKRLIAGKESKF